MGILHYACVVAVAAAAAAAIFCCVDDGDGVVGCARFCAAFSYSRENVFHLYFAKYKTQLCSVRRRQSKWERRILHGIVKY